MADFQRWISNFIIEPLRTGLFNSRTQFNSHHSSEDSSGPLKLPPNSFHSETYTSHTLSDQVSQDPLYNLIRDSAKFIYLNFGVKFNCMGVTKANLFEHYQVYAADIEQQNAEIIPKNSPGHSQLSKFLLFFMHPFQILPEENKFSFPTLSRSFPDSKRDRSAFMMSVCGSKFTQMGRLCFASNITPITNIEIGLKADELEVGEIAEDFFAKSVPSTSSQDSFMKFSNDCQNAKSHKNVHERPPKSECTNVTLDDSVIRRDRQRRQSRKRKNRRRKQNRRNREESSSSKGSSGSSNQDSDFDSDTDHHSDHECLMNNDDEMIHEDEDFMDVDNDCDDLVIFVDENDSSTNNHHNSIANDVFLFGFEDMSEDDHDEDDDEDDDYDDFDGQDPSENQEDLENLFFGNSLSFSSLVNSNSRTASDNSPPTEAINIVPRQPSSPGYIISPSPDLSSYLTEDDIRRNQMMAANDSNAPSAEEANERWTNVYKEECTTCDREIQNRDSEVIVCPAKRSLVKFSDEPKVIFYSVPEEEKQFLKDLQVEIDTFSPFKRDGMNLDDDDEDGDED